MQGKRSAVDSFTETFEFDHGSSSSNTGVDQQIFWNNMLNPIESQLSGYVLSPSETSIAYGNVVNHSGRGLSGWNLGEPSSSENARSQAHDETKMEHEWSSSSSARAGVGPRLEERRYEATSILSLESVNINLNSNQAANEPLFLHNSSSDDIPHNINLNARYVGSSGNGSQVMEDDVCPHKSDGSETEQISFASGSSDPFGTAIESSGYVAEENNGRPDCSLNGRRLSCKRKALEGASGQSSLGGSTSCFQQAENSTWHDVSARDNTARSLSISTPTENLPVVNSHGVNPAEQLNLRSVVGMRGAVSESHPALSVAGNRESSQRNFRMRVNHSQQQNSVPADLLSQDNAVRRSNVWSPPQSSRLLPLNHSSDSRPTATITNTNPLQSQSHLMHVLGLPRNVVNVHHFAWNGPSNSRVGTSSSSIISGNRGAAIHEEGYSRGIPRYVTEHPMLAPVTEMRNLAQDPTSWSLANGNISIPGNIASTSQIGSSSGVHPSPPTWIPQAQYPHRLSEFVHRPFFASAGSESVAQSSNSSLIHSGSSGPSQELMLPSRTSHQRHRQQYPRSAFWMERQGDGVLGVPYPLRSLAAASEGRSRLVSEVCSFYKCLYEVFLSILCYIGTAFRT